MDFVGGKRMQIFSLGPSSTPLFPLPLGPVSVRWCFWDVLNDVWHACQLVSIMGFTQVHIVQRGAVRPLIDMLESPDAQLKEMSAFALGRLAQVIVSLILFWSHALFKVHIHMHIGRCIFVLVYVCMCVMLTHACM